MKELLSIYPNKFKVIRNLNEIVEDCNIYYVSENIPDDLVQPLTMWISDVLEKREYPPAGFQNTSISYVTFCQNYGYDISKLSYKLGMSSAKEEHYYSNGVNPIRFRNGIMGEECILLWGQQIIQNNSMEYSPLLCECPTIDVLSVIMNVILVYLKTDINHLRDYIYKLIPYRLLYDGDVVDNVIRLKPICFGYYINLDINKNSLERIFNSMMKSYTHTTYDKLLEDLQIPSRLIHENKEEKIKTVEDYESEYMNFSFLKFEEEISRVIKNYSKEEAINAIIGLTRTMEDSIKEQCFIKGENK